MIKLWTATTTMVNMDSQMTPRAGNDRNPFDMPSPAAASVHQPHPLLTPTRLSVSNPFDLTPGSSQPPTVHSSFAAALPTTSLSLHAPDFNMHAPPRSKPQSLSPPPPLTNSRGQIHVKLIQARSLNVHGSAARPYVVVQFEQNEFVSRDPTDEADKEVKGVPSKTSSSTAVNALARAAGHPPSPSSSVSSKSSSSTGASNGGLFGRVSATNPVWKHEVSLCVAYHSPLVFCLSFL